MVLRRLAGRMFTRSSGVSLLCLRTMSSGTIEGPQLGADKAPVRGPEKKAKKHSADGSEALSRMSAGQATSSDCSHIDRSEACPEMRQVLADFIEREFEEHLRQCTREIIKSKNRRINTLIRLLKKATKKSGA